MKEHEKLCSKMMSEFVCIFVWGHLCLWKDVTNETIAYLWQDGASKSLDIHQEILSADRAQQYLATRDSRGQWFPWNGDSLSPSETPHWCINHATLRLTGREFQFYDSPRKLTRVSRTRCKSARINLLRSQILSFISQISHVALLE